MDNTHNENKFEYKKLANSRVVGDVALIVGKVEEVSRNEEG